MFCKGENPILEIPDRLAHVVHEVLQLVGGAAPEPHAGPAQTCNICVDV